MNNKTALETEHCKMEIKNGILFSTFYAIKIDLQSAKKIVEDRLSYVEGLTYPVYIDSEKVISINREAKEYFVGEKSVSGIKAAAIVGKTLYTTWMINFFINFTRKKTPFTTKFFSDKQKAIQWLEKHKDPQLTMLMTD